MDPVTVVGFGVVAAIQALAAAVACEGQSKKTDEERESGNDECYAS